MQHTSIDFVDLPLETPYNKWMGYLQLFRSDPRPLIFGLLNGFFSSLGQTHLVSLFGPALIATFELSNTQYGSLYSLATLGSAMVLPFIGPLIDRKDLRYFCMFLGLGMMACEIMMISPWLPVVVFALFGLRLIGQGLCSQVLGTSIARYFDENRGKALGITIIGFPLGEALLTPVLAYLLDFVAWQSLCLLLAGMVFAIYIPAVLLLTTGNRRFNKPSEEDVKKAAGRDEGSAVKHWTRKDVFYDKTIYMLLPQAVMPPFALTGLLFHQATIASLKGWTLAHMASGLIFFAITRTFTSFVIGTFVDKYSARRLFPFYLIPLSIGMVVLATFTNTFTPFVCFALFGLSVGCGGPIKSAIWAELYGTLHLGAIKSSFATIMVFSTAVSPFLFGYILDVKDTVDILLWVLAGMTIVFSLVSGVHLRKK